MGNVDETREEHCLFISPSIHLDVAVLFSPFDFFVQVQVEHRHFFIGPTRSIRHSTFDREMLQFNHLWLPVVTSSKENETMSLDLDTAQ